ncbi:hypothetical protein REPUB_Repub13aG0086300 [Reevesia pubescens]
MAESIISLAIERITDLLIYEASFLNDVKEEVESLKAELERMKSFLKDVDRKQEHDERLRTPVREIRSLAYYAEDVIDSHILKVAHQGGFQGIIKRFTTIFTKPSHLHKIGKQVKAIQTKLGDISRSLPAYGISGEGSEGSNSAAEMQRRLRRSYPHVEEDDVVSLEVSTRDVMDQLMKGDLDRLHVVVSIVGMGGIGKTTLAKKIKVLSPKNERELIDKLKEDELVEMLYDVLKEKRYLVVLDDIWRCEDWDSLKPAFPKGNKGSKFLFTTRNKEVALLADPCSCPIELPLLTDDESWQLFRRKAFPENKMESQACSKEFEMLGKEMLKKCGGLPLAIVVLGGLLATKKSWNEWEMVQKNINAHLNKFQQQDYQYGGVNGILALSYKELPFNLKPCFLYLGHYPEDSEISKKELIRLWIAEVGKRDHTGRGVKTYRIHDLLRDLCVSKAREENVFGIVFPPLMNENKNHSLHLTVAASKVRRIAVHPSKRYLALKCIRLFLPQSIGDLRSLHTLSIRVDIPLKIPNVLFKMERLRHLILNNFYRNSFRFWHVVKGCRELTNIRSLGIRFKRSEDVEAIMRSPIVVLDRLRSLHMDLELGPYPNLEPLSQCHHLSKLSLTGKIREDPHSSHHVLEILPKNISKLTLRSSSIKQDPMAVLEKLPHLRSLFFDILSFEGTKLSCSSNGFPQLDSLEIKAEDIEEWQIEEGAMPRLRILKLEYVPS